MEFNEHTNARPDWLYGIWYGGPAAPEMILVRKPAYPIDSKSDGESPVRGFFQRFEFYEDGTFLDEWTPICGNEGRIHSWTGNWRLSEDGQTLVLQIENYSVTGYLSRLQPSESYKRGQELQIIEITEEMLKLVFKEPGNLMAASPFWAYDKDNI